MCLKLDKKMPDILKETKVLLTITKLGKYSLISDTDEFGIFSRAYLFTNENIKGYYENLNMEGKDILTVVGSGDHILNAILKGAKKIDAFDISAFAIMLYYLKEAAIKSLSYEEFTEYFLRDENPNNLACYSKIRTHLKGNALVFWDFVYENIDPAYFLDSLIFRIRLNPVNMEDSINELCRLSEYLEKDKYYELQRKIGECEVNCYCSDCKSLYQMMSMYDYMFFSNIVQYQKGEDLVKFKNAINRYFKKLKSQGEIKVGYVFGHLRRILSDFPECEVETIPPVDDFFEPNDFVLTLRKN